MPTIRIGFSSDFVLNNNRVGLGTTVAAGGNLDVDGAIKGNFSVTGVATLTSYGGLVAQKQQVNKPATIGFGTVGLNTAGAAIGVGATQVANQYYETETGFTDLGGVHHGDDQYFNTLSEDLVIDDGQILNITNTEMVGVTTIGEYDPHNHSSYVCAGSLEQVSVTDHFSVPNGGINDRQETPIEGTVRFNTDLNTLEFFNGNEWRQFTYNQGQSGRALIGGGYDGSVIDSIEYVTISTLGNAQYFGDLSVGRLQHGSCASEIRGLWCGGATPDASDVIDYVTIASGGNAIDFGNSTVTLKQRHGGLSSSTRGIFNSGQNPAAVDLIEYVEISTIGNALDFGDLSTARYDLATSASPTRGIFASGFSPTASPNTHLNVMDFITISSKGDAVSFGEISVPRRALGGGSNSVRGIFAGGNNPGEIDVIEYITIASVGNAIDFGRLSEAKTTTKGASSNTRVIFSGGITPSYVNAIEYVTIASLGDAQDFGDLSTAGQQRASLSDSHGGLGGF
jgi:hypothetical protein